MRTQTQTPPQSLGVQAVGVDTDKYYWKLRNSWGPDWVSFYYSILHIRIYLLYTYILIRVNPVLFALRTEKIHAGLPTIPYLLP